MTQHVRTKLVAVALFHQALVYMHLMRELKVPNRVILTPAYIDANPGIGTTILTT